MQQGNNQDLSIKLSVVTEGTICSPLASTAEKLQSRRERLSFGGRGGGGGRTVAEI